MSATVDLSAAYAAIRAEAEEVLARQVIPFIVAELRQKWPKDTGLSAASWDTNGASVYNPVPYVEHVKNGGGLALETVLQPILNQAAERTWQE